MKNIIKIIIVALTITVLSLAVSAKNGDAIGGYYYTDIVTYIYHAPVTTYNIRAEAVIDAEILNWHYGFDVYWHADKRWLEITDKGGTFNSLQALSGELCDTGTKDKKIGNYYATDITVTVNGVKVTSYNIGGRTCIAVTDLRKAGYTVVWDSADRTLTVTKPLGFYTFDTDFGLIKTQTNYECSDASFITHKRGLRLTDASGAITELPLSSGIVLSDNYGGVSYISLSDLCGAIGAECVMTHEITQSQTYLANGASYTDQYYTHGFALAFSSITTVTVPAGDNDDQSSFVLQPNEKCYKLTDFSLAVNGNESSFLLLMGGNEYPSNIYVIGDKVFVPAYTAAKLLGYKNAY